MFGHHDSQVFWLFTWSVHRETGPGAAKVHGVRVPVSEEGSNHLHSHPAHRGGAVKGVLHRKKAADMFLSSWTWL